MCICLFKRQNCERICASHHWFLLVVKWGYHCIYRLSMFLIASKGSVFSYFPFLKDLFCILFSVSRAGPFLSSRGSNKVANVPIKLRESLIQRLFATQEIFTEMCTTLILKSSTIKKILPNRSRHKKGHENMVFRFASPHPPLPHPPLPPLSLPPPTSTTPPHTPPHRTYPQPTTHRPNTDNSKSHKHH